jgi:hypothetical protein
MTLAVISRDAALARVAQALRIPVPGTATDGISLPLIAQAVRRAAHILAPCPRHELERAVQQSLKDISADIEEIATRVAEALESLLAYGDILEMRTPAGDPWTTGYFIVRPSPPTFVVRKNGSAIILGVAGDEITPLPSAMNERIGYRGVLRALAPEGTENLRLLLAELGLVELSEKAWLHLPPTESAMHYRQAWAHRLSESASVSAIEGLQTLDTRRSSTYYSGRWVESSISLNGMHVGRRPQRYGSSLWCLVDLVSGVPRRLLDLASKDGRERPCDLAWRIQMAIDAECGAPQRVRIRSSGQGCILDFFSPLPCWAERKLAVTGERVEPNRSLLSYVITSPEVDETVNFIKTYLWITPEMMCGRRETQ